MVKRITSDGKGADILCLLAGVVFGVFPSLSDGNLCKFNRGVGLMAKATNTKVVPFAIKGGFESWGRTRKLPKLFNNGQFLSFSLLLMHLVPLKA